LLNWPPLAVELDTLFVFFFFEEAKVESWLCPEGVYAAATSVGKPL
jgi:hypothetical protein